MRFTWKEQKKIDGIQGMTPEQIELEVQRGGRFVAFQYCVSVLVVSFRRSSDIFFIHAGEGSFLRGLPYTLLTLTAGWWAIPWGPVRTLQVLATNLRGGKRMTKQIMTSRSFARPMPTFSAPNRTTPQTASSYSVQNLTSQTQEAPRNSKYCPYCGTKILKPATYCSNCGKRVQPESPALQAGGQGEKAQVSSSPEKPETPLGAQWPVIRVFSKDAVTPFSASAVVFFGRGIDIQALPERIPDSFYLHEEFLDGRIIKVEGKYNKAGTLYHLTSNEHAAWAANDLLGSKRGPRPPPLEHNAFCRLLDPTVVAEMHRSKDNDGNVSMTGYVVLRGAKSEAEVREVVRRLGKMLEDADLFRPLTPLDRIPYGGRDDPRAYDYFANDSNVWSEGFFPDKVE